MCGHVLLLPSRGKMKEQTQPLVSHQSGNNPLGSGDHTRNPAECFLVSKTKHCSHGLCHSKISCLRILTVAIATEITGSVHHFNLNWNIHLWYNCFINICNACFLGGILSFMKRFQCTIADLWILKISRRLCLHVHIFLRSSVDCKFTIIFSNHRLRIT